MKDHYCLLLIITRFRIVHIVQIIQVVKYFWIPERWADVRKSNKHETGLQNMFHLKCLWLIWNLLSWHCVVYRGRCVSWMKLIYTVIHCCSGADGKIFTRPVWKQMFLPCNVHLLCCVLEDLSSWMYDDGVWVCFGSQSTVTAVKVVAHSLR